MSCPRRLFPLVGLLLLAGASLHAQNALTPQEVESVMERSGLSYEIEDMATTIRQSVAEGLGELDQERRARLDKALAKAYDPAAMRVAVRDSLRSNLSREDYKKVMEWLSSPLGMKVTELERSREADMEMEGDLAKIFGTERLKRIEKFAAALEANERLFQTFRHTVAAMANGSARVAGEDPAAVAAKAVANLEAQRPQLEPMLRRQLLLSLADTYRPLSDEDFDRYLAFAESPSGRRWHQLTWDAIDLVMAKAATEVGAGLARYAE